MPPRTSSTGSARHAQPPGGKTEPRLWTPPLRPLNRRTSLGYEAADFAALAGEPLMPWQRWAAIHALETNPDGTFRYRIILIIVARQNGKSHLKRAVTLWRMYMHPGSRILGVAQEVRLAREQWTLAQDTIRAAPDLAAELATVRNVNGDESFTLANGSRYAISAASRKAGRGMSTDELTIDELREQRDWKAWAALSKTTMAREGSQIWCMSNAGDDESVVLNSLRDAALSGRDPSIGLFEWSAPDGCELSDWAAIRQANPSLGNGNGVGRSAVRTALATDPPEIFRTEVLCQRVVNLDHAVDPVAWKACADPSGTMNAHRDRIAACLDVAPDGAHATLAVAAKLDDGRARTEIAAAWKTTADVTAQLPELLAKIRPAWFAFYPAGPAAGIALHLRQHAATWNKPRGKPRPGDPPPPSPSGEISGLAVTEACQQLAALTRDRALLHSDDPLLNAQINAAQKLPSGDGWRFTRRGGTASGHVDAAYAAAGAIAVALALPQHQPSRIRWISLRVTT